MSRLDANYPSGAKNLFFYKPMVEHIFKANSPSLLLALITAPKAPCPSYPTT